MDLSALSTADLEAYAGGNLDKMSDAGLKHINQELTAPTPQPGVEMRASPEGPSGAEHLAGFAGTAVRHPLMLGVGMLENAANAVTAPVQRTYERMAGQPVTGTEGYQPRSEAGQELAGVGGQEGERISNAYDATAGTGPWASSFKEAAGKAADIAATAGALKAVNIERLPAAVEAGIEAPGKAKAASIPSPVQKQVQRGIEISPSSVQEAQPSTAKDVPGTTTQSDLEGPDAQRTRILKNAAKNNADIANGLGINATDHITPADIDEARGVGPDGKVQATRTDPRTGETKETDLNVYDRIGRAANGQPASGATAPALGDALAHTTASSTTAVNAIERMVKTYQERYAPGTPIDGDQIQGDISTLRQRARIGLQSDNLDQQDIGMAARRMADTLEKEMASHAPPDSQLASDFKAARTHLAQLNDAETALKGGSFDPQVLSRIRAKGAPLTGPLADVADAAEIAPKDVMHPQKAPPLSQEGYTLSSIARKVGSITGRTLNTATGGTNNAAEAVARHVPPAPEAPPAPLGRLTPPPGQVGSAPPVQATMGLPEGRGNAPPLSLEHPPGAVHEPLQRPLSGPSEPNRTPMAQAEWDRQVLARIHAARNHGRMEGQ